MEMRKFAELDFIDAILLVWGFSYFVALIARPDMYAGFSIMLSAVFLGTLGILLILSVFLDRPSMYFFMSLGYIYGFIISWTGIIQWNVPYDPGTAAVSMAAIDFFIATILMYKAFRTSHLPVPLQHPHPEQK